MLAIVLTANRRLTAKTNRDIGKWLVRICRRATPKDTGNLSRGWYLRKSTSTVIEVRNDVYYGYWVEEGNTRGAPAQQFMEAALDELESTFKSLYTDYDVELVKEEE
jgi:hypothetical protein